MQVGVGVRLIKSLKSSAARRQLCHWARSADLASKLPSQSSSLKRPWFSSASHATANLLISRKGSPPQRKASAQVHRRQSWHLQENIVLIRISPAFVSLWSSCNSSSSINKLLAFSRLPFLFRGADFCFETNKRTNEQTPALATSWHSMLDNFQFVFYYDNNRRQFGLITVK